MIRGRFGIQLGLWVVGGGLWASEFRGGRNGCRLGCLFLAGIGAANPVPFGDVEEDFAAQLAGDFGSRKNRLQDLRGGDEKGLGLVGLAFGLGQLIQEL